MPRAGMAPVVRFGVRYGVAASLVAAAAALTALMPPLEDSPLPLFFAAVTVSAWHGGLGPGLLATGLSVLAIDYWFIHPVWSLGTGLADGVRLTAFALVAALTSWLNAARRRAEEALRRENRRQETFLNLVAHELRTPLGTVLQAATLLRLRGAEREAAARAGAVIERQGRVMTRLIEDLVDAARVRLGKVRLCKESVELRAAAAAAAESVRPLFDERRHRLEVRLPADPVWVDADPLRLGQIVTNLLTNAAKYTEPGGRVWLEVGQVGGRARLSVRDNGVGLTPGELNSVFDWYKQVEGGRGGLGIGLSLVRELVALHGGSLEARSEGPGKGSEFVVSLGSLNRRAGGPPAPARDPGLRRPA